MSSLQVCLKSHNKLQYSILKISALVAFVACPSQSVIDKNKLTFSRADPYYV